MPIEIRVPQLTQTMTEAEVVRWIKAEGEEVKVGEPLLEVVTDKATVDVESPAQGVLGKILVEKGVAPVGKVICVLLAQGESLPAAPLGIEPPGSSPHPSGVSPSGRGSPAAPIGGRVRISPLAKRLAAEKGMDISLITPTGPGGLIVEGDVRAYLERAGETPPTPPAAPPLPPVERVVFSPPASSDEEVIPLVGVRRIIADRMSLSRHTAADVTTVAEVDMGEVSSLREHLPFTYTSFAAKAVAQALTEYPILNSRLEGDRIILGKRVHLGVAVAIEDGLKVPVLKDAQALTLRQLGEVLADKARRGAEGKLGPDELSGSTFTLTNSGVFGSLFFTPIINPPESAILGMGKIMKMPVVRNDEVVIRPMMYLCLTYDHRVIDGEQAVKFLQRVKALLENPALLL